MFLNGAVVRKAKVKCMGIVSFINPGPETALILAPLFVCQHCRVDSIASRLSSFKLPIFLLRLASSTADRPNPPRCPGGPGRFDVTRQSNTGCPLISRHHLTLVAGAQSFGLETANSTILGHPTLEKFKFNLLLYSRHLASASIRPQLHCLCPSYTRLWISAL